MPPPIDLPGLEAVASGFREARLVVLFGSVARGTPFPWSDADIGVAGCSFWDGLELGSKLGEVLGREAHVVDLDTASDLLRWHTAREGIPLREREPGGWASFQAQAALRYFDLDPIVRRCTEGVRRRLVREAAARG